MTSSPEYRAQADQLAFGVRQARRSSAGAYIASPVIAFYLALTESSHLPLIWLGLMFIVLTARNHWLSQAAQDLPQATAPGYARAWRALFASSLALALTMAWLPTWALPELPLNSSLFLTCVLCAWLAAGMASLGVLPRLFMAYAGVVVLGLCLGWLRSGDPLALPLVGLLLAYLAILLSFSRSFSRIVARGFHIRLANARLVKELQLANEAKSRFILAASHDLRQPLHALSLFSGAISHSQTPEQTRSAAEGIRQSVDALVQLLSAVLDLSKMDAQAIEPHLSPVYLPELINRLAQEYAALCRDKGLRWQSQQLPVTLRTDPVLLERLLRNLLDNAVKHGGHGPVGIGMALDKQLTITVTDHGPGIPPNEREHIFEEFYRLPHAHHAAGLGLGLSIVRRIVHLLGYRLGIDYAEPQQRIGTCFRLDIPLAQVLGHTAPPERPPAEPPGTDLAGLPVLVIDDDEEIVHATLLLLRQWGCRAEGDSDLQTWLAQPPAPDFRPAVTLIDSDQGTGTDVLDVACTVSARWPETGILLVTGQTDADALSRLRQSGYPLLEKPVDPGELRGVLEMFQRLS